MHPKSKTMCQEEIEAQTFAPFPTPTAIHLASATPENYISNNTSPKNEIDLEAEDFKFNIKESSNDGPKKNSRYDEQVSEYTATVERKPKLEKFD